MPETELTNPATTRTLTNEQRERRNRRARERYAAKRQKELEPRVAALARLGHPEAGGRTKLVYTTTAAEILGITLRTFDSLDVDFEAEIKNSHGPGWCRLYDPCDLERLVDDPRVIAGRARRGRQPKDYTGAFLRKYGARNKAIPEAAEALWNLNRYTAHDTCTRPHREEIYEMKNSFVELLCCNDLLVGLGEHTIEQREKIYECFGCHGTGESDHYDDESDYDDRCCRCGGTGIYRTLPARKFVYRVLRFRIGGRVYTWHQPDDLVHWKLPDASDLPESNLIKDDYSGKMQVPTRMRRSHFARAKALIRWVLGEGQAHV